MPSPGSQHSLGQPINTALADTSALSSSVTGSAIWSIPCSGTTSSHSATPPVNDPDLSDGESFPVPSNKESGVTLRYRNKMKKRIIGTL